MLRVFETLRVGDNDMQHRSFGVVRRAQTLVWAYAYGQL